MKKYLTLAAAAALVAAAPLYLALQAQAEDAATGAAVEATTDAAVAAEVEVMELMLADGTKVHVKGEDVFVVGVDGVETPAPDGEHTLMDGTTVKTMGGKKVVDAAPAMDAAPAEAPAGDHADHGAAE